MIIFLKNLSLPMLIIVAIGVNWGMYLASIFCYRFLQQWGRGSTLHPAAALTLRDLLASFVTIACNTLVFIIGALLWKKGIIEVNEQVSPAIILVELVVFIIAMDLMMYLFHRVAHLPVFYRIIHGRHHEHRATNAISLFVLHPAEALGFGALFIFLLLLYSFSAVAIAIYLSLNLLWGTVGHLNKEIFPAGWSQFFQRIFVGTTFFHNQHHQRPNYNFGFYTSIWDRLFGTLDRDSNKRSRNSIA